MRLIHRSLTPDSLPDLISTALATYAGNPSKMGYFTTCVPDSP